IGVVLSPDRVLGGIHCNSIFSALVDFSDHPDSGQKDIHQSPSTRTCRLVVCASALVDDRGTDVEHSPGFLILPRVITQVTRSLYANCGGGTSSGIGLVYTAAPDAFIRPHAQQAPAKGQGRHQITYATR